MIGDGKAGQMTKKIRGLYKMLIDEYVEEGVLINDFKS